MDWFLLLPLLGVALVILCGRLSNWHSMESSFWREMSVFAALDIAPDDAPALLKWAQTHRPSWLQKVRGWKAPHVRRAEWLNR